MSLRHEFRKNNYTDMIKESFLIICLHFFADLTLNTQQVALTAVNPEPCISFTAVADDLGLEGQEMLTLSLSGPSNVMFQNVSLTVIINDGDGMYLHGETLYTGHPPRISDAPNMYYKHICLQ